MTIDTFTKKRTATGWRVADERGRVLAEVATKALADAVLAALRTPRILLHLSGGLVQGVGCTRLPGQPLRIAVIDFDTDGAKEEEICRIEDRDGRELQAVVRELPLELWSPEDDVPRLAAAWAAIAAACMPEPPRRRPRRFSVTYDIHSGIDSEVVRTGRIVVRACTEPEAGRAAVRWVHDNDPHCDERIDPVVEISGIEALADDAEDDADDEVLP